MSEKARHPIMCSCCGRTKMAERHGRKIVIVDKKHGKHHRAEIDVDKEFGKPKRP